MVGPKPATGQGEPYFEWAPIARSHPCPSLLCSLPAACNCANQTEAEEGADATATARDDPNGGTPALYVLTWPSLPYCLSTPQSSVAFSFTTPHGALSPLYRQEMRQIKRLAQGHPESLWQNRELIPVLPSPSPVPYLLDHPSDHGGRGEASTWKECRWRRVASLCQTPGKGWPGITQR